MARVPITVVTAQNSNLHPTTGDDVNDHSFAWSPHRQLIVRNADASAHPVTVITPGALGKAGLAIADDTRTVAAGATVRIDTRETIYRQATGLVHVDLTDDTGITLGVLDLA
ncbi:hypothetical protein MXD62_16730 [Frankia sp. Mgl5]|uniref:hypothetical protein n=1 Tax=Frankia sp. Mgl5 TaxID=2933793 RepID=UPI00200E5834|nr:hypothetical protein [Frankia sp. Mgl5]MCK9928802.1 hypothetical protein [Frankia sp. Mgl5]